MITGLVAVTVAVALGFPLLLYVAQDSLIFHPPPAPPLTPRAQGMQIEVVKVPVAGSVALSGWLAKPQFAAANARLPLAIYFGGNAEEVSWMASEAANLSPWALLAVNYRGYGGNPGSPGEAALLADALAVYDWAVARPDVDPDRIVVFGRSLGSGVAVHVAAKRKVAGAVLVTPFDSLLAVAQGLYPFVPVSMLLRHPFDSVALAPAIDAPSIVLAATNDRVIPMRHARRLHDAWRGPKEWVEIGGADHNSISENPCYWESIAAFLAARFPMPARR